MDDVSGSIFGARTPRGSSPAASTSRSPRPCLAAKMSVPSLKTAVTTERPWIDWERSASRFPRPLIAFSTGRVTSDSTCSGVSPGASVWTITSGGTKSGKTSSLAWSAT